MQARTVDSSHGAQVVMTYTFALISSKLRIAPLRTSQGGAESGNRSKHNILWRSLTLGLIAGIMFSIPVFAQDPGGGTLPIFQLGVGARAIGLGSAVVAMPLDASTVYWNPGGLDFLERRSVMLFYSQLMLETRYHFIGMAYPMLGVGTIGAGWLHYDTGDIKHTEDVTGRLIDILTAGEDLFLLSYAKQLPFALSVGGSFKFQRQNFVGYSATGYGADLGLLYRPDFGEGILQNLSFGLTLFNALSPRLKLDQSAESIPHIIRGGIAKSLRFGPRADLINLFMAFEKGDGAELNFNLGSEYVYQDMAMLRFGNKFGPEGSALNFGGGLVYQMFQIDYAFGKFAPDKDGEIPYQHRISLTVHFGKTKTELREIAQAKVLQRIEAETRRQVNLNRQNEFEEKINAGKVYYQQGDYYNALIRFAAARDLVAGAYDIFSEAERADVNVWVDRTNNKIAEETKAQQEELAKLEREKAAVEQARSYVEAQFQKGMKYFEAGKYREAVEEWQRGLERDPNNAQLKTWIAKTQNETRNRTAELLRQARTHENQGRIVDAIRVYNQAISQNSIPPTEQKAIEDRVAQLQKQLTYQDLYRQGYTEYLNKNYRAAMGLFAQALEIDPKNAKIREYYNDAEARANARLEDFNNDSIRQRFLQAIALIQKESYEAALRILEEIQKEQRYNKRILDAIDQARERMKKPK